MTGRRTITILELRDQAGRRLVRARLPEGVAGIAELHELIAAQLGEDTDQAQVLIGIDTDRGRWVECAGRGRLSGVCEHPAAGGPLPAAPPRLGREKRRR
jgi:hypothetical protein